MEKEFNINNSLNNRENLVLRAVALDYIRSAFPVSSICSGLVRMIVMNMEDEIKKHRLSLITYVLNELLCGVSVSEIKDKIEQCFPDLTDEIGVSSIIKKAPKVFNFSQPTVAKLSGTSNLGGVIG